MDAAPIIDEWLEDQEEGEDRRRLLAVVAAAGPMALLLGTPLGPGSSTGDDGGGDDDGGGGGAIPFILTPTPPVDQIDNTVVNRSVQQGYQALQGAYEIAPGELRINAVDGLQPGITVASAWLLSDARIEAQGRTNDLFPVGRIRRTEINQFFGYVGLVQFRFVRIGKLDGDPSYSIEASLFDASIVGTEDARLEIEGQPGSIEIRVYVSGVLRLTWTDTSLSAPAEGYCGVIGGKPSPSFGKCSTLTIEEI